MIKKNKNIEKFAVKSYTDLPDSKEDLMNKYIEDRTKPATMISVSVADI